MRPKIHSIKSLKINDDGITASVVLGFSESGKEGTIKIPFMDFSTSEIKVEYEGVGSISTLELVLRNSFVINRDDDTKEKRLCSRCGEYEALGDNVFCINCEEEMREGFEEFYYEERD